MPHSHSPSLTRVSWCCSCAQRLFDIEIEAADGEVPVWDKDVRFFRVKKGGKPKAFFFLDPYSRPVGTRPMGSCRCCSSPAGVEPPLLLLPAGRPGAAPAGPSAAGGEAGWGLDGRGGWAEQAVRPPGGARAPPGGPHGLQPDAAYRGHPLPHDLPRG